MFDRIGRAAERAAQGVSRRDFFGRVGRGAAIMAGALGGVLLSAPAAHAGGEHWCCYRADSGECKSGKCTKSAVDGLTVRCEDFALFGCPHTSY